MAETTLRVRGCMKIRPANDWQIFRCVTLSRLKGSCSRLWMSAIQPRIKDLHLPRLAEPGRACSWLMRPSTRWSNSDDYATMKNDQLNKYAMFDGKMKYAPTAACDFFLCRGR